jgi:hypothetical protein
MNGLEFACLCDEVRTGMALLIEMLKIDKFIAVLRPSVLLISTDVM